MQKKLVMRLPFLFYLIPYTHLSLAIDYLFDSIVGIFLFLLLTVAVGFYAKLTQQLTLLIFGNIINILLSCGLILFKSPLISLYHSSSPFTTAIPLIALFFDHAINGDLLGLYPSKGTIRLIKQRKKTIKPSDH